MKTLVKCKLYLIILFYYKTPIFFYFLCTTPTIYLTDTLVFRNRKANTSQMYSITFKMILFVPNTMLSISKSSMLNSKLQLTIRIMSGIIKIMKLDKETNSKLYLFRTLNHLIPVIQITVRRFAIALLIS